MERSLLCGDQAIVFTLKRSRRRRTVALRVAPSGAITVYAPPFVWGPFIDRFVRQQKDWIARKLDYFKNRPVPTPVTDDQRTLYTAQTQERLEVSVARMAERVGVSPKGFRVAHQTSRWGSCSTRGQLRFSWRMATLPEPVFDYIVLHELAHLKEMNHGPRFWAIVQAHCPEHKAHRRWLRTQAL